MAHVDELIKGLRDKIEPLLPVDARMDELHFEAHELVLTTSTPAAFAREAGLLRKIARASQKRIVLRSDPACRRSEDEATAIMDDVVPADAGVTQVSWDHRAGQVTIEATKPGLVIGPKGATVEKLRAATGWTPHVLRTPPLPSRTVYEVREYLRSRGPQRDAFLRRMGRRVHREPREGEQWARMTALGAWREVGRSCAMLQTQDSKVVVDCGVKFDEGDPATPFFGLGEVQPFSSIDAVVLTHGHLDHCGLVPLLFKHGYDGPVYATPPTRDLMALLCIDYLRVAGMQGTVKPYDAEHVRQAIEHVIPIGWNEPTDIAPDLRLTFHNAGHILGSSVVHFGIAGDRYNVAFSGDIKYETSWLFDRATNKFPRLDALVVESTYGGREDNQPSRAAATDQTRDIVTRTTSRGGKTVFPVFAVGRSQEVMVVLEELMRTGQIPRQTVYLDGMIWEATAIHSCYPEYLNEKLKSRILHDDENPMLSPIFVRVESREQREAILADPEPCIVLATSGMLTGGPVLEYLRHWADDGRNTLCFVGFNAEGTMGRRLQNGWREIQLPGTPPSKVRVEMDLETIDGFSGHCDRRQLMNFVQNMDPRPSLILTGHGEASKCIELAASMAARFEVDARSLQNAETIRFR